MITFSSITQTEAGTWLFQWTGTGPWRIVHNGEEIEETISDTEYEFVLSGYENTPPLLEIVELDEFALSERNIPRLYLQWHKVDCVAYEVERWNGSSWIRLVSINEDGGEIYSYWTALLNDCTEYSFRVQALNSEERESESLEFQAYIVRPPDKPADPTLDCIGGTLTLS